MLSLHAIEEPAAAPRGLALWALGFRPFYLLAAVYAALSVPLWALQATGRLQHALFTGPAWHGHEMLFGFALAVIVGFLFTAGRAWTNRPTPTGPALMALVALWVAARVLVWTPWGTASLLANLAFPWAAAAALAVPFWRARNRRNYFFVGLLLLMGVASAVVHLTQRGVLALPSGAGLSLGLDIVLFMLAVMGGRVIPMFTNNGVPGAKAVRRPRLEQLALGGVLLLGAADLAGLGGVPLAALAAATGLAHLARWGLWQPWATRRVPLVWVLHAAYVWLPVHLLLRAGAALGVVPAGPATHALTAGAIGGLVIAMITRTALGHTGRPLRADAWDVACYALVLGGALLRVVVPLVVPGLYVPAMLASAGCWSAGFALYAWRYAPVLMRPRRDGRPG